MGLRHEIVHGIAHEVVCKKRQCEESEYELYMLSHIFLA